MQMAKRPKALAYSPRSIYFYTSLLLLISCFIGTALSPGFMRLISQEDHLLENLSTGLLLGSALLGLTNWKTNRSNNNAIAFFTILAIIGFLDEISFGQRIINFTPPMAGGTSLDGFHDLANMSKKVISINLQYHPFQALFFLISIALALIIAAFIYKKQILSLTNYLKKLKINCVVISSIFAILFSQLLDVKIISMAYPTPLEETLELIASASLLTCLISTTRGQYAQKTRNNLPNTKNQDF